MTATHLTITWTTSRARDTYGYPICRLTDPTTGRRWRCYGGGYDMLGTVVADWLEEAHQTRLAALYRSAPYGKWHSRPVGIPGYYHKDHRAMTWRPLRDRIVLDGGQGLASIQRIAEAIGLHLQPVADAKGRSVAFTVTDHGSAEALIASRT
ncbi:hypothetical protein [Xylophilus sp.]|uniref:hypothetical protein n=1 Tax=Xylophilus sp. TaxID=2653893 RepID=UPI0013BBAEAD|nr:hypothetical protein [Xylophilus sp.]KAF1049304.1 MAG: hypothetical protein GAK38_00760 [Xylophilus sp.]